MAELVATVHARLARRVLPALPIVLFPMPMPMPMPPLEQAVQWHKLRSLDPGLLWLRQFLQKAATAAASD